MWEDIVINIFTGNLIIWAENSKKNSNLYHPYRIMILQGICHIQLNVLNHRRIRLNYNFLI